MRFVLVVVVLAIAGLLVASTGQARPAAPQLTCKYGFKWVTKTVHGHKKRVKVCKAKPKPKRQADLELTTATSAVGNQITVGNHVSYTFVIENKGPEVADAIELTADLPTDELGQVTFGGGSDAQCASTHSVSSVDTTHLTCQLGTLAPEGDQSVEGNSYAYIQFVVEPSAPGDHVVTAQVKSALEDPHPEDNSANLPLRVLTGPAAADLSVSLSSSPDPATVRGGFAETVSVTNTGPTVATDVNVTVLLPPGVVLGSLPAIVFGPFPLFPTDLCSPYGYGTTSAAQVCFDSIAPGETQSSTIRFVPSIHSPPTLETAAVVSAYTPDPNLANNRAATSTALAPFQPQSGADLVVGIDPPKAAVAGKPFAFGIRLVNAGLGTANDVDVRVDTTPALDSVFLFVGALNPFSEIGCGSDVGIQPAECTLDEVPSDARLLGYVGAQASKPGTYTATVTVTSPDLAAPLQSLLSFTVK
jgi:hypothetical protein